jgi:pyridoxal phosphate enzyme (YggS family)
MDTLATRLAEIQQGLGGRDQVSGSSLRLPIIVAASKTVSATTLEQAITLDITDFGENKVQEAYEKWPALKAQHPDVRLHLIGALQSNKAKEALALFDVIHTVDRPKLVDALVKAAPDFARHRFLIQVNTGSEPQKAGVLPEDLPALLNYCAEKGLNISGLMCIPPAATPAAPHFALLKKLADRHGLAELSMGMSSDYAVAARMGATMVRIGTALFGERQ